jgi:hypothetical protein
MQQEVSKGRQYPSQPELIGVRISSSNLSDFPGEFSLEATGTSGSLLVRGRSTASIRCTVIAAGRRERGGNVVEKESLPWWFGEVQRTCLDGLCVEPQSSWSRRTGSSLSQVTVLLWTKLNNSPGEIAVKRRKP